ncbi:Hypothetical predicted protein [Octopus vulgaris]|uniref:Uncharacterized protein n=1 Tax=Octopus vulgaris TaxID=6645 RepID=A0AA36F3F3_OCTVU|nr:Hypothetical predicted protein [Octopus vulgaris]
MMCVLKGIENGGYTAEKCLKISQFLMMLLSLMSFIMMFLHVLAAVGVDCRIGIVFVVVVVVGGGGGGGGGGGMKAQSCSSHQYLDIIANDTACGLSTDLITEIMVTSTLDEMKCDTNKISACKDPGLGDIPVDLRKCYADAQLKFGHSLQL